MARPRDLRFERAIAFAQDLIRIPSPPGAEEALARRVRRELETLRFDDVWTDDLGNVLARVRGTGSAPPVLLACHLDAVDPGDPAEWEHPPYAGRIDGGWLHGRGAIDIKGPLALQTYAAATFLETRPPGDLLLAHTVLEERGGWGMDHVIRNANPRPAAVILGEATGGDIAIGHRGRAELVIEARGRAGHASAPDRARNALDLLPAILTALHTFARSLPADPLLGPSTLAPTQVETLPRNRNVIPDRARVYVDWRLLPGMTPETARATLEDHLRHHVPLPADYGLAASIATERQRTYTGLEEDRLLFTPGFLLRPDHPVPRAAAAAAREATGREPAIRPWTFATDGGHTCGTHHIPTIGYAPGDERFAHTARERLELAQAHAVYRAYPAVIRAVQRAAGETA